MITSLALLAQISWFSPFMIFLYIILGLAAALVIGVTVVKRCYLVVGPDKAIVKTGWGAMDVTTAGGMLVFPPSPPKALTTRWILSSSVAITTRAAPLSTALR